MTQIDGTSDLAKGLQLFRDGKYTEALRIMTPLAEQGNATAQYCLSAAYFHGHGVDKDEQQSFKHLYSAAIGGHAQAQYELGARYCNGRDTEKNYPEAIRYFSMASDKGYARAQFGLGFCYFHGFGIEEDLETAIDLFNKAADQNYPPALRMLGLINCSMGEINSNNARGALIKFAAYKERELYDMYEYGNKDAALAAEKSVNALIKWMQTAIRADDGEQMFTLSVYLAGETPVEGIGRDFDNSICPLAAEWLVAAKKLGHKPAEARIQLAKQRNATPYDQSIIAEAAKSLRPNKWFGKKPKQNKPEPS